MMLAVLVVEGYPPLQHFFFQMTFLDVLTIHLIGLMNMEMDVIGIRLMLSIVRSMETLKVPMGKHPTRPVARVEVGSIQI
jgi:hypothetical protein